MIPTINSFDLLHNTIMYSKFSILKEEYKWWEYFKKRAVQEQMDWYYPLMRGEIKNIT